MASCSDTPLAINVATENHRYLHGIGEILYTLKAFFSRIFSAHSVTYTAHPKRGVINVLIDEFSDPATLESLAKLKADDPRTKVVIVATEFITPVRFLGREFPETFNYFDPREDRKYALAMMAHRMGLRRRPPYMQARHRGFLQALQLADLVIAVHPAIVDHLLPLSANMSHWVAPPVNLYPEINVEQHVLIARLRGWPAGFVMTGTKTRFRQHIVETLTRTCSHAGIRDSTFSHSPFERRAPFEFHDGLIEFPFEKADCENQADRRMSAGAKTGALFNLNPPQRANWPYSSPMRILRAAVLGQIPVITRRFGDHEIEMLATLWEPGDPDTRVISEIWHSATLARDTLIENHLASISKYNETAKQKNEAVGAAFHALS